MKKKNNRINIIMNKKNKTKNKSTDQNNSTEQNTTNFIIFIFIFIFLLLILFISLKSKSTITESSETNKELINEIIEKKQILHQYQMEQTWSLKFEFFKIAIRVILIFVLCFAAFHVIKNDIQLKWREFLIVVFVLGFLALFFHLSQV